MTNLIGKTFGRLTVVSYFGRDTSKNVQWKCTCTCGNMATPTTSGLQSGNSRSCGCLAAEIVLTSCKTHGMYQSREYRCWVNMKARCNNTKHPSFYNYGGRGIKVCTRWHTFENFYVDMGKIPGGLSLERVDNNKNYALKNCVWANRATQNRNQRRTVKERACDGCGRMFIPVNWRRPSKKTFCTATCYHAHH